jgi:predicted nicotinamide N-methyase
MEFDPLSLFTPAEKTHQDSVELQSSIYQLKDVETKDVEHVDGSDDDHLVPLHVLDLPMLQLQPCYEAMVVLLQLLSPSDVLNFGGKKEFLSQEIDVEAVFKEKNISPDELESALAWLKVNCPRLNSCEKLGYLPQLSESFRMNYSTEYNRYMTNVISNELSWMDDPNLIHKLASLRLSENCGRTAQPEITRKIALPNLSKYVSGESILLKEPSLTSDNLGLKTWGSSLILSRRLLKNPGYIQGQVLELGSGTGLVGMVCAILGFKTYLTDLPEIVPNLRENINLNAIDCVAHELDWCDPASFIRAFGPITFETIVVSDPIYSPHHPQWVVNMIKQFLKPDGRVMIQLPLRPGFEQERANLWKIMSTDFVELEMEIEDGSDDFGEMKFCFKLLKKL